MLTFDIDFEYSTSISIQEMLKQLGDKVEMHTLDQTILVKIFPGLKESLVGQTIQSDCRMFALLLNCFYYQDNPQILTMGLSHKSTCDLILPQNGTLLCLSLSRELRDAERLRAALDDQQSQWICQVPSEYLPENPHQTTDPQFIGLTSHGIKTLSLAKWL